MYTTWASSLSRQNKAVCLPSCEYKEQVEEQKAAERRAAKIRERTDETNHKPSRQFVRPQFAPLHRVRGIPRSPKHSSFLIHMCPAPKSVLQFPPDYSLRCEMSLYYYTRRALIRFTTAGQTLRATLLDVRPVIQNGHNRKHIQYN